MASDNGSNGVSLLGVVVAALLVAVFAYFLIGDRLGLRDPVSTADVRVESARVPSSSPNPAPSRGSDRNPF
jgi:hypothetical protein